MSDLLCMLFGTLVCVLVHSCLRKPFLPATLIAAASATAATMIGLTVVAGEFSNIWPIASCFWFVLQLPLAALVGLPFYFARKKPILPGCCQRCGYDLRGNVSGRCPECGTMIDGTIAG